MVFYPPEWVPKLPFDPPDSIPICDFMLDDRYGRVPIAKSRPFFICGLSGKKVTGAEVSERVDYLARALAKEFHWSPNEGTEWDKVCGVFSLNALDTIPLAWATHRLGGIQTPANAAYTAEEVAYQMKTSGAQCIFTCIPLLETTLKAAKEVGIPKERIYLLELPKELIGNASAPGYKTVSDFVEEGKKLPPLEPLKWGKGEGERRTAFLCYSSGTSGFPKGVMISHRNVIANTMQITTYDNYFRQTLKQPGDEYYVENELGLLPFSHIYALVVMLHAGIYRGDGIVILPKFEFQQLLKAVQDQKISTLYLVPPIVILMTKNKALLDKFDLSAVKIIFTGAAPLGEETAEDLQKQHPDWLIRQGYGLTETSTVVCSTSGHDIWFGSSGCLISSVEARIVSLEGNEITGYDQPGELLVKSPAVVIGYLNNEKANRETFVLDGDGGRWMRTGDEALIRKAPSGNEHVFIVDRIKELIKVKGLQVAPAELEAHLLTSDLVADCAVIPVPDDDAGEVPKAFVVKAPGVIEEGDGYLKRKIQKHVEQTKSRHKWLKGGVEFVDVIPKSPSGKILRRLLRDKERENRRKAGAKM